MSTISEEFLTPAQPQLHLVLMLTGDEPATAVRRIKMRRVSESSEGIFPAVAVKAALSSKGLQPNLADELCRVLSESLARETTPELFSTMVQELFPQLSGSK